jgi:hypothetical protein
MGVDRHRGRMSANWVEVEAAWLQGGREQEGCTMELTISFPVVVVVLIAYWVRLSSPLRWTR